ncbi:MAG: HPr kinase/phosphatase C-terminal domain-containing protein [Pseudomonadota bacterium]|nr:HPr kinase/phosphatase C-terminal domain-containing protein [Pseudomonadota bacterium]MEE3098197.1 HPr kinase/phosphatase C-terminal domain-containing protein [Pseudomonadota bacterium]
MTRASGTGDAAEDAGGAILHASCVAAEGPGGAWLGALILGPSGSGKSALALEMISRGARLVADDRTRLRAGPGGALLASCPAAIAGLIEARGIGILRLEPAPETRLALVADLSAPPPARLPEALRFDPPRGAGLPDPGLPRILCAGSPGAAAALLALLRAGGRRHAP